METTPSPTFATLLRRCRQAAGLSQEELAERAGLSVRTVGDLERSASQAPRKDTVALLAGALDLAVPQRAALAQAARRLSPAASRPSSDAASRPSPDVPPSPALVGRSRELALLERHICGEGPPVLLLAGEPGIGKTRLLHAVFPRAAGHGLRVLEGGCQRWGDHEPYAPLLSAVQRHLHHAPPAQQRTELEGCAWLVRLLPELAAGPIAPLPAWTLPPEQERRLMVQAVLRFLSNVAGPAGTLLVLDDLQWAGPDALDLLMVLARSAAQIPLRVIGAYRDTEVGPRASLSVTLADLAQAGLVTQHTLQPLTPQESGHLLAGLLVDGTGAEPEFRQRILQRTGGVPFFLLSCVQALRTADGEGGGAERVPWDMAQGLRQRVAALPEAAQEVLGVAAVVGREVALALLTAVAAQGEEDVLVALDAACRARLLEEGGVAGYQFAHDVIREVVEADLGAARRTVLHRRIAEALEQQPGEPPVELLAYHYARSDIQEKAILYLEQAGDRAQAQYANAAAQTYSRELVDCLDRLGRVLDAAGARETLGAVLRAVAQYDAALTVLERAAETYRAAGDVEGLARALAQIGHVHADRGTPQEGVGQLQSLLETVGTSEQPHCLAALYGALAHLFMVSGQTGEQLVAAERAMDLALTVGDDRLRAEAAWLHGLALLAEKRTEDGLRVTEQASRLAEVAGDLRSLSYTLNNLGTVYSNRQEYDKSRLCFERALAFAERLGDPVQIALVAGNRGWDAFVTGDWDRAGVDFERAVALSRQVGMSWNAPFPLLILGGLRLAEGQWDEASRYLEEGLSLAEHSQDGEALHVAQRLLAERDLLQGRPHAALARLSPLLDHPSTAELERTPLLPLVAWAHLELGEDAAAAEVVTTGIWHARAQNHRLALADVLRVQAIVATRKQCWAQAEQALEEGLALTQSMPYPYAEGRLLHVYGAMHTRKGEPEPARERLEAARAIFRRLGARKDAERVEQALRTLQSAPAHDAAVQV